MPSPHLESFASQFEEIGGGVPRFVRTRRGGCQFIFPNGLILRFDLASGQYSPRYGPHINLEGAPDAPPNLHIRLR